ncbi:MAG: glutamyl-tRNA reductase [Gemmatimonadota bacterium]|jgi:glutamyl-tRNA reductase|nr:glutamyl-tRNA reductase [Gemmatimonadota bacterium]MDP6530080.1 glutamyl-tRNA reductase [Gemmatimonadota bacterium]MDP6803623.1 glutamyl-tRNA reductase [Gemmatimonadota bacterium]MDP7032418.1 glutamyl-tRNA reductase [Gemmatimonadota bacterium]
MTLSVPSAAKRVTLWGVDHHRASTEVRERVHLSEESARVFLSTVAEEGVSGVVLSTCNRTEVYLEAPGHVDAVGSFRRALDAAGGDALPFEGDLGYRLDGMDAVAHLYRVVAGLESMMVGETQIVGQVKDAYRAAREIVPLGPVLLRAFQGAFRAGKLARGKTKIDAGAVSVAFAAVDLSRKLFEKLESRRVLLVGAGETGALAARHFLKQGAAGLAIANRSAGRAEELVGTLSRAHPGTKITAHGMEELEVLLAEADIVLSTTGSTVPVILPGAVHAAMERRNRRPLFLLDIAVPRDVDPEVAKIGSVFLFGLDDLEEIVQGNVSARLREVPAVEEVLSESAREFEGWIANLDLKPTVDDFRAFLEELKAREMGRLGGGMPDDIREAVEQSLAGLIRGIVRRPVVRLKSTDAREERTRDLDSLRRLFELD